MPGHPHGHQGQSSRRGAPLPDCLPGMGEGTVSFIILVCGYGDLRLSIGLHLFFFLSINKRGRVVRILSLRRPVHFPVMCIVKLGVTSVLTSCHVCVPQSPPSDVDQLVSSTLTSVRDAAEMTFQKHPRHGEDLNPVAWQRVFTLELLCSHTHWKWTHDNLLRYKAGLLLVVVDCHSWTEIHRRNKTMKTKPNAYI